MAAPAQFEFDGVFQYGPGKLRLTIGEVGAALGVSDQQVRDLVDEGLIVAAPINDSATGTGRDGRPAAPRQHLRVERWSVVGYWRWRMEQRGMNPPFRLTPEADWWRNELKARKA